MPGRREGVAEVGGQGEGEGRPRRAAPRSRTDTRRGSARLRRGPRARWTRSPRAARRSRARRPRAARASRAPRVARLPVGGHDLRRGEDLDRDRLLEGVASRPAASPSSGCARGRPPARARRSAPRAAPPPAIGTVCVARRPRPRAPTGSRLRMVTMAVPLSLSWLCTTEPKRAVSPTARKRGKAGLQQHGLAGADLALRPAEARGLVAGHGHDAVRGEALGQRDVRRPRARRRRWPPSPSQKASTRKSLRTSRRRARRPLPRRRPRRRPSRRVTRRLMMFCRESSVRTCSAFSTHTEPRTSGVR